MSCRKSRVRSSIVFIVLLPRWPAPLSVGKMRGACWRLSNAALQTRLRNPPVRAPNSMRSGSAGRRTGALANSWTGTLDPQPAGATHRRGGNRIEHVGAQQGEARMRVQMPDIVVSASEEV